MLLTIGATVVTLGVLIFVHELGHFLAAKAVGVQVLRFSLGFGRPIMSWRRGETDYWVSWIPFGGYVKMAGLEDEGVAGTVEGGPSTVPIDPARAFDRKPLLARLLVIIAGVTMNAIFAFVVYAGLAFAGALEPDNIATTRVDSIPTSELPSQARVLATLHRGERITTVNGDSVRTWGDLRLKLAAAPSPIRVGVAGRKEPLELNLGDADTTQRVALVVALNPYLEPVVASVVTGSAGAKAGIHAGDRILKVEGDTVVSWADFARIARAHPGQAIRVEVLRGADRITLSTVPDRREEPDPVTRQPRTIGIVGVTAAYPALPRPGFGRAILLGWEETRDRAGMILTFLGKFVTGRMSPRDIGGPLLIGQVAGQAARVGVGYFLAFMAFLSINLMILNLLPIPILDGGQVVFLLAEAVRRKPLPVDLRVRLTQIGFVVLLGIMIYATSNDIWRWLGHAFKR